METFLNYALEHAPTVVAVGIGVWFLTSRANKRELHDARLASSIDHLTAEITEVGKTMKHMGQRLDEHEIEIALLKQKSEQ